jgi:hypothetical protein
VTRLIVLTIVTLLTTQSALRIVVIEGEGAVNIIQQKTAVAPIVEVRDRNNLPVGGVTVTFTIQGGKTAAFAGGSQTMTVTTNAAGRAIAAAVNPLSNGTVQIQAAAVFQGQTAVATITQTNVMTAAEAGASPATAGGAAGGGGISGTAIAGIAGGVAAGGAALALTQKDEEGSGNVPSAANSPTTPTVDAAMQAVAGTYTLQTVNGAGLPAITVTSPPASCRVATDNATLLLNATSGEYEVIENSRTECTLGPSSTFRSSSGGSWSLSGGSITFTARSTNYVFDVGTLNGSTITVTAIPPHADAGITPARINMVFRK